MQTVRSYEHNCEKPVNKGRESSPTVCYVLRNMLEQHTNYVIISSDDRFKLALKTFLFATYRRIQRIRGFRGDD